ncbi:MAG: pentapeptide repeat-containing protein [Scytolyngbya sp. HA4215-MV1]|jgi:uncharacterized protein YjbI with pentapeptide repeats|nr:pentapeptide repeat-containing protein [Scytolyngbya sp. HA4215-MV1]
MKAREVLQCYAAGERDFRRTNLRGQSFRGQDLSGADFSEADIRGSDFTNAILNRANFTYAKAGVRRRWLLLQKLIIFVITAISSMLSASSGLLIATLFLDPHGSRPAFLIAGWVVIGLTANTFITIAQQGFTVKALLSLAGAGATASTVAGTVAGAVAVTATIAVAGAVTGAVAVAVAVAVASAVTVAGAITVTIAVADTVTSIAVTVVAVSGAGITASAIASAVANTGVVAVAVASASAITVAIASLLLGFYSGYCAFEGDERFALLYIFGVAFGALGGTLFRGADLTHANFSYAVLKGSNFNHTTQKQTRLEWVCWQDAQKLDRARVGNSILANPAVRDLLVTRNGYKKSYIDANLRAANLDGVNLEQANLTWADLSGATLRHASLKDANLTESLVLNTDFTGATLTGSCLEAWNIDCNTQLESVDCQYVYLLRNQQERRPSSGDFAPGEFTKLFQEVLSTVDLIFRNGIDWKAFAYSFNKLVLDNAGTELSIQSIENKGDGVVVVRVNAPPDADKAKLHSEFNQTYETAVQALEAKYQAELKAKDDQITIYRQQSADMLEITRLMANRPINVQAFAEAKAMNESTDTSRKIEIGSIGGNFHASGQALNLGDISGTVTNTINQLPDVSDDHQSSLKELLTQLQQAIETDADLPDPDKADLLEQVQILAKAKQTEEPAQQEGIARKAKKMFDATLKSLPETAKIVEACSKLLPMILKALGLSL